MDAEKAHRLVIGMLARLPAASSALTSPLLASTVAGVAFPNPVGLAPGFDKDAEVAAQIFRFGFGFAEIGTLTPLPQAGNDKPRLFRLVEDEAVINRMGFNNGGQKAASARISAMPRLAGPLGVNIGANKDSVDRIADYAAGVRAMEPMADYLTVNISSPNTPGLRALQDKAALDDLLCAVRDARCGATPVFLKVAPDLEPADIDDIVAVSLDRGIDALIVSNTTIGRPSLRSPYGQEAGGLSGAPLAPLARQRLKDFRSASGGAIPLIAVGGIATGADAYERIRAGASLVQLYSAMVFLGPGLAAKIARDLEYLLRADGLANIAEAIGVDV